MSGSQEKPLLQNCYGSTARRSVDMVPWVQSIIGATLNVLLLYSSVSTTGQWCSTQDGACGLPESYSEKRIAPRKVADLNQSLAATPAGSIENSDFSPFLWPKRQ
jgi:hypothetical protein